MSKESDNRFTPQHVLDVVREFAPIALDPCTTAHNPVRAAAYLTEREDGLAHCWSAVIADRAPSRAPFAFVNCPYSRGQQLKWARKAVEEWQQNQLESVVLVPADTSTRASQLLLAEANAVAFWRHRITFVGTQGALFASAFYYFGDRQGRFRRVFERWATVLVLR